MPADGEPGRYSLMSAIANASASTPAHCAIVARNGSKKVWKRALRAAMVRLAEERDAPPRDDATQFQVRERDAGDGVQQGLLIGLGYEVRAIVEASREIVVEETR